MNRPRTRRPVPHLIDVVAPVLAACAWVGSASGGDDLVFGGTGAEFVASPLSTFPTATPNVVGSRMDMAAFVNHAVLARYPIAPAGLYGGGSVPVCIRFEMTLTRLSDDFDPVFVVGDGVSLVGGQVGDNPNGSARLVAGTLVGAGLVPIEEPLIFTNAGFVPVGGQLDAIVEISIEATQTEVTVRFLNGNSTASTSVTLDPTAELSFMLVANSQVGTGEVYGIDELRLLRDASCPGDIADDFGTLGADGMVSFGDFLALLGLIGACPGMTPGCTGDIADDFGTLNGGDGMVSFGDFLALLGLIGPCP